MLMISWSFSVVWFKKVLVVGVKNSGVDTMMLKIGGGGGDGLRATGAAFLEFCFEYCL